MATTEFIAAIELGSSKITGVAGKKNSDGSMQVLAYAQEDSSTFIRKGVIFNLDKTAQSLTSIINRLEGELKNSIAKVYVGIGGQSLRTVRNVVSRDRRRSYHIGRTRKRYRRREHCRSGGRHGYIGRSPAGIQGRQQPASQSGGPGR